MTAASFVHGPMSAFLEQDNNAIFFLTDARRHKDEEIAQNPAINLSFADAGSQKYVSIAGTAAVSNDRAKIKELFSTPAKAWWDSAEDPNIRVLKITPTMRNSGIRPAPSSAM